MKGNKNMTTAPNKEIIDHIKSLGKTEERKNRFTGESIMLTKEEAKKIALDTCVSDYDSSDLSTSAGDFEIDEIEEVQE